MGAVLSRRSVLAALGLGLGAALAGCEGTLQSTDPTAGPGPNQPTEGSPSQPADSEALLLALTRSRELAAQCRGITGAAGAHRGLQGQVQSALDEQVSVLEEVLTAGGVPVPEPTAQATSTGDQSSSTGDVAGEGDQSSTTGDVAEATGATAGGAGDQSSTTGDAASSTSGPDPAAERAAAALRDLGVAMIKDVNPTALETLSTVSAANLPMLISVAAVRGASARLLGKAPEWADLAGPTDAAANSLLAAYRPAVYGLEVLAARSREAERTAYEAVLTPLRQVTRQITQLAGQAAAPAPLGYGLPDGPLDAQGREQLATDLLAALPPTIMGQTRSFSGDVDSVAGSVRLLADAVRLGQPWAPLVGFPGMRVPGA